ncbi:MAG: hypothetical protein OK422_03085 [Thaumarchaeota archaeon]|nr:hypothetical protein [Nitrososphaerota archaeon]
MKSGTVIQVSHQLMEPQPAAARIKKENKFTSAFTLLGLLSQIDLVDRLIGGLKSDSVVLISGSGIRLCAAESYCVRTQLPERSGGLNGKAFFIDGGNGFDVYLFTSIARENGIDLDGALGKLIVSRAFTPYELKQLVCRDSSAVFSRHDPRLLVVSDIFSLFNQDVEEAEAQRLMHKITATIRRISERRKIPIVMTAAGVPEHLKLFADYCCNVEAEFLEQENRLTARLLKHPSRAPVEVITEMGDPSYNQLLLSPLKVTKYG